MLFRFSDYVFINHIIRIHFHTTSGVYTDYVLFSKPMDSAISFNLCTSLPNIRALPSDNTPNSDMAFILSGSAAHSFHP